MSSKMVLYMHNNLSEERSRRVKGRDGLFCLLQDNNNTNKNSIIAIRFILLSLWHLKTLQNKWNMMTWRVALKLITGLIQPALYSNYSRVDLKTLGARLM